jgi:hypothetical protein
VEQEAPVALEERAGPEEQAGRAVLEGQVVLEAPHMAATDRQWCPMR